MGTIHEDENEPTEDTRINELAGTKEIKELEANSIQGHSKAYVDELKKIRKELPEEIKDFADIFCSED